jgi:fatty-acid desaturase
MIGFFRQINSSNKLRAFHLLNHIALIAGLYFGELWMWVGSFLIWNIIGSIGISIGFHRLLSHKSLEVSEALEKAFCLIGCLATGGSPLSWAGAHRMHHAYPDGDLDPHSPKIKGAAKVYLHLWGQVNIKRKFVSDLIRSPFHCWVHRNYFLILTMWVAGLYTINPLVGIFCYSVPATFAFHSFGLINTLCHKFGYRNYETRDSSTNNWFVNIFTCGEGWHNNHHRYPGSYRIRRRRFEFDLSAFIIEVFRLNRRKAVVEE